MSALSGLGQASEQGKLGQKHLISTWLAFHKFIIQRETEPWSLTGGHMTYLGMHTELGESHWVLGKGASRARGACPRLSFLPDSLP